MAGLELDLDLFLLTEAPRPRSSPEGDIAAGDPEPGGGAPRRRRPLTAPGAVPNAGPGEDTGPDDAPDPSADDDTEAGGAGAEADADDPDAESDTVPGEGDDLGAGDDGGMSSGPDPAAAAQEQVRREELYGWIEEAEGQAADLAIAAASVAETGKGKSTVAAQIKSDMEEAARQSAVLRAHFLDLGYDNARRVYDTVRERVTSAAASLKHEIDGDDELKAAGSGEQQH